MTIQKKYLVSLCAAERLAGLILANDLPREWDKRKRNFNFAAMGSGDPLQVNGVGGGNSLTGESGHYFTLNRPRCRH
ncbi:hypothetical protein P4S68_12865 [Pseudoalteromonas sp. Hal099]